MASLRSIASSALRSPVARAASAAFTSRSFSDAVNWRRILACTDSCDALFTRGSYAADDAKGFDGRAAEIDELIGRLRAGEREIYVIGPSGSGKSSLVAAGLAAARPRYRRAGAVRGPGRSGRVSQPDPAQQVNREEGGGVFEARKNEV